MSAEYRLTNERTGQVIASRARLADGFVTRAVGLMGQRGLGEGEALVIRPCWSIHTFFMRFKLDVLYLDKQRRVKKIVRQMPAWRFSASRGAHETIEMQGGALDGSDIEVGDVFALTEVTAQV